MLRAPTSDINCSLVSYLHGDWPYHLKKMQLNLSHRTQESEGDSQSKRESKRERERERERERAREQERESN